MRYINSRWLWLLAVNCIRDFQSESEREYHERRMEWREGERARHCGRVRRGGWMRINQSGVLPMQPSNPHIRENSPRMLPHSPLGLSRSLSTDASPPFLVSRLGYTAWRIEVRAIYHWRGKSARHRPTRTQTRMTSWDACQQYRPFSHDDKRKRPHRFRDETRPMHPFFALSSSCSDWNWRCCRNNSKKLRERFLFHEI